jgi:hypothetical protein
MPVPISMGVFVRTGRMVRLSATRLAMMPAAGLAKHRPSPEISGQLRELFRERHRLIEIGEETADQGPNVHCTLAFSLALSPGTTAARLYHFHDHRRAIREYFGHALRDLGRVVPE